MSFRRLLAAMLAVLLLVAAGCGDDGGEDDGATGTPSADEGDDPTEDPGENGGSDGSDEEGDPEPSSGSGDAGSMVLGEETIAFDSSRCHLEEQEAAAGGGTIELTGQAFGTNADGEEVMIDVTRFSEESMFAGDDISVLIGDPMSEDATSLSSMAEPAGTVSLDGSTLSASDLVLEDLENIEEQTTVTLSFEIQC